MQAIRAAKLVQVKYKNRETPVLTIQDALNHPERVKLQTAFGPPTTFDFGNTEGTFEMIVTSRKRQSMSHFIISFYYEIV